MKTRFTPILSALLCLSLSAAAQFPGAKGPKRLELGYSYVLASANYSYAESHYNEKTGLVDDTSYVQKVKSKGGFGGLIGYSWPLARMGDNSCLALSVSYYYNAILWESGQFSYSYSSQYGSSSVGSGTIDMGLPIGVDFKFGCDALADRSQRLCYGFGLGLYPSIKTTVYKEVANSNAGLLPYLKAELGVFAGICFKVRALYSFGNIRYVDYHQGVDYTQLKTDFKGKSTATLSLIIMPFSWKFGKSAWWH